MPTTQLMPYHDIYVTPGMPTSSYPLVNTACFTTAPSDTVKVPTNSECMATPTASNLLLTEDCGLTNVDKTSNKIVTAAQGLTAVTTSNKCVTAAEGVSAVSTSNKVVTVSEVIGTPAASTNEIVTSACCFTQPSATVQLYTESDLAGSIANVGDKLSVKYWDSGFFTMTGLNNTEKNPAIQYRIPLGVTGNVTAAYVLADATITGHADNWYDFELYNVTDTAAVADYSTDSDEDGTITADTPAAMTVTTPGVVPGDLLELRITKGGAAPDHSTAIWGFCFQVTLTA